MERRNGTPYTDKLTDSIKTAVGDTVSNVEAMQAKFFFFLVVGKVLG